MDTRNVGILNYGNLNNVNPHSLNYHLRGGTSGVHMRNFSDIEPIKTKNKSFFNKYKESRKDIVNVPQQQLSYSSVGEASQITTQSNYKRPRTNSPFPNMRVNNLQYNQFNQEMINRLNQSENLVLNSDIPPNSTQINQMTSQFMITPIQPSFIPGIKNEHIMTPPYPKTSNQSLNNSQQNTATNQNSKAFFQRMDPSNNNQQQTFSKNQKIPAFVLSPNQIKYGKQEFNNSQILSDLNNKNSNTRIPLNGDNSLVQNTQVTNQSRNRTNISFQQSQGRSLSTEQTHIHSRNLFSSDQKYLSNNENIESLLHKNIKLEPISRFNPRHQRNNSFNENFVASKQQQVVTLNKNLINNKLDSQYTSVNANNFNDSDLIVNMSKHRKLTQDEQQFMTQDQSDAGIYSLNQSFNNTNPIFRTADKAQSQVFTNEENSSSFRVENRKARPKIIKNVNNICNIFIFQNGGNSGTQSTQPSQQRKRRIESRSKPNKDPQDIQVDQVTPSKEQYTTNTNTIEYNQNTLQIFQQHKSADNPHQTPYKNHQPPESATNLKDQYYFTFFKENQEQSERSELQQAQNISLFNRPETILSGQIKSDSQKLSPQNINYNNSYNNTTNVSKARLPNVINSNQQQQQQYTVPNLLGNDQAFNEIGSNGSSSNQNSVYFQQNSKRPLKKPQSPKKLLPQCFLDVNTNEINNSRQQKHTRTSSETPQLMNNLNQALNVDAIVTSQSSKKESSGQRIVVKNNKIYVPQKVIHRLNERSMRNGLSSEEQQLIIREVQEQ